LPQITGVVKLASLDNVVAAISFCPAIAAVAPIMVTKAIMHNVLDAVFIFSPISGLKLTGSSGISVESEDKMGSKCFFSFYF